MQQRADSLSRLIKLTNPSLQNLYKETVDIWNPIKKTKNIFFFTQHPECKILHCSTYININMNLHLYGIANMDLYYITLDNDIYLSIH